MVTPIKIQDQFVYYHEGVQSRPEWAYRDAKTQIETRWAGFCKAMPNTSNVLVGTVAYDKLGGDIARYGEWASVEVSGAGSKTKNEMGKRSWKAWFTVKYSINLVFLPTTAQVPTLPGQMGDEEVLAKIAQAKLE